jgi:transposase
MAFAWVEKIHRRVYQGLKMDFAGMRVDNKNHWVHVSASEDITLKFLHRHRGKQAMEDINIIPRYGGAVIHDCWASYLSYHTCSHALCGSNLLRELTFVVESNGYAWAKNMKRLLQETCKTVANSPNKTLSDKACRNPQKRYRNILTRGEKELPPILKKQNGRRGKIAKSDAHNLWERLRKHEGAVLLFANNAHVAFTNNRAECKRCVICHPRIPIKNQTVYFLINLIFC